MNILGGFVALSLLLAGAQFGYSVTGGDWVSYETDTHWVGKTSDYSVGGLGIATITYEWVTESEATAYLSISSWDGKTSSGYISISADEPSYYLIPGRAGPGDTVGNWTIDSVTTDFIAGEERELLVSLDTRVTQDRSEELRICWDRETGVMVEFSFEFDTADEYYFYHMMADETSLWPKVGLLLTIGLESDVVKIGEDIGLSARLVDESGNPVSGASLVCTVYGYTIFCTDQGNGYYSCSVDSSSFDPGNYLMTVEAEKTGYAPAQTSLSVDVERGFPIDLSDPSVQSIGGVIATILAYLVVRRVSSKKREEPPLPRQQTAVTAPEIRAATVQQGAAASEAHKAPAETRETPAPTRETVKSSEIMESYRALRRRYEKNEMDEDYFNKLVSEQAYLDDAGNRWRIGAESGRWYTLEGGSWVAKEPPETLQRKA